MRTKSTAALYLLFAEGFCFLLISAAVIACGFVLNYQKDFDYEQVDAEHDYTQYWVGFVLLITAFYAIAAGAWQRSRWTVVTAMFLFLVCICVSLFALLVEGNDWISHKNNIRRKGFWESEDYECASSSTSCECTKTAADTKTISNRVDCKTLERLDYLYGGLISCILAGVFLALSSIIIVLIFIPIRPFTVPVPKKRIKKITVLEDKPPVVLYKPAPKPKPEVQEVVIRRPPPQRVIVEPPPEPKTEVQEIVVRERRPRVQTIVYEQPRPQPQVIYKIPRTRTLVYDEPRQQPPRTVLAIEPPPEPKKEPVYDVGRFVPKVHPTPAQPPLEDEGFIVNPNFKKEETLPEPEPEELQPVHFATREVEPPIRYVQQQPAPVRYAQVKREPAPYVRKPTIVYERRPRVVERPVVDQTVVPPPMGRVVIHSRNPKPSYIIRRPGQNPLLAVRRRRANSDEGPGLYRAREAQPVRRVYTTQAQPQRPFVARAEAPRILRRVRSNSDEGAGLYRQRPARIYTDKEIAMQTEGNPGVGTSEGAKPRVFTKENVDTANLRNPPSTAHFPQSRNEGYDRELEANLPSADQLGRRPGTPY